MSKQVRIINPLPGSSGSGWLSRHKAKRYVACGRAEFAGPCAVRFLHAETSHGERSAHKSLDLTALNYDRLHRILTIHELRHIPVVNPQRALNA